MEETNKIYLQKTEYDDFYDFLLEMNNEEYLRLSQVVRIYLDVTSKRAYMTRIEGTSDVWYWISNEYQADGPYFVYRDSLDNITKKLSWYE